MNAPPAQALFRARNGTAAREAREPALPGLERIGAPLPERRSEDFYPTPPEPIRALLAADGERIRACGSVWEPACGDGAMVREIRAAGIPCCASDLVDRGCPDSWTADYFTCLRSRCPAVVTNPPYALANGAGGARWLKHTLASPDGTISRCCCPGTGPPPAERPSANTDSTRTTGGRAVDLSTVWDRAWTGAEPAFRFLDRPREAP